MNIVFAIFVFVQIVFEVFPLSSSGHLRIFEKIFYMVYSGAGESFALPFWIEHFLQGPPLLAIAIVFWHSWQPMARRLFTVITSRPRALHWSQRRYRSLIARLFVYGVVVNSITALFFALFHYSSLGAQALANTGGLFLGFLVTLVTLLSLCWVDATTSASSYESLSFGKAIMLGFAQGCALFPGISRFASIYVAGRFLRLSPRRALHISFLMPVPISIFGFVEGGINIITSGDTSFFFDPLIMMAMLIGTVLAFFFLRVVVSLALQKKLWLFGLYLFVPLFILIMLD